MIILDFCIFGCNIFPLIFIKKVLLINVPDKRLSKLCGYHIEDMSVQSLLFLLKQWLIQDGLTLGRVLKIPKSNIQIGNQNDKCIIQSFFN